MRARFYLIFLSLAALILLRLPPIVHSMAVEQEPQRWQSGDTLWFEVDSLPFLPSDQAIIDSLRWHLPSHTTPNAPFGPLKPSYRAVKLNYNIPYWSIYRHSITIWGITFSAGQPSPYAPYPAANSLDAEVLSFPLNHPH